MSRVVIFFILFFINTNAIAQLCTGSLGDPIVNITFGAGANPGASLSNTITGYSFFQNDCPQDGSYTIRNNTTNCNGSTWHSLVNDHTGNANGYFMLINASNQPSDFYVDTVLNLCPNSTYEFAAWVINMLKPSACGNNGNKPNITFSIETTNGALIQSYNTNDILTTNSPTWLQYGFFFTTPVAVTSVVLRMRNNAPGGCGNDLAIDDITFRRCGPLITPTIVGQSTTSINFCEGNANAYNFVANVSSGFTNPEYIWQQSVNGNMFTDINGANTLSYAVNFLPTSASGIYKYRLTVSEQGTSNLQTCRVISDPITITINAKPILAIIGNNNLCLGQTLILDANTAATFSWTGPINFTSSSSTINIPNVSNQNAGLYSVIGQSVAGCQSTANIIVAVSPRPNAVVLFSDTTICKNASVKLLGGAAASYNWFPAFNISNTTISNPIVNPLDSTTYFLEIINQFGCKDTAAVKVNVVKLPSVDAGANQILVGNSIVQLNGNILGSYQSFIWTSSIPINNSSSLNPTAQIITDQVFYLTATAKNNCGIVADSVLVKIYAGVFIPNAFTPNADGVNDTWNIPILATFPNAEVKVYNRYGQLIYTNKATPKNWDGNYKGEKLPTGNYVYVIDFKNGFPIYKGSVMLLR